MRQNRSIPPYPGAGLPDVREAVGWLNSAFELVERIQIGESHRAQLSIGADGAMLVADLGGERHFPDPVAATHVINVRLDGHIGASSDGVELKSHPSRLQVGGAVSTSWAMSGAPKKSPMSAGATIAMSGGSCCNGLSR